MQYISHGTQCNSIKNHVNAPLFKRVFDSNFSSATISITVVGLYKLYLNGKLLNRSFFAPYMSNPDQVVYTDTYEVDELLPKDNVLCVLVGNGFAVSDDSDIWLNSSAPYRAAPKLALSVACGDSVILQSDGGFKVIDSPITFDDFRCGERYDARLERPDVLTSVSLDGFEAVTVVDPPKGEVLQNTTQPIVAGAERKAVKIIKNAVGYLYDFGVNDTGLCRLTVDAVSGQQIDLYCGETLSQDNRLDMRNVSFDAYPMFGYVQHDSYVCKDGKQSYLPSFTWHGCRYCEVMGLTDEQATPDAVVFVPTHTELPTVGTIECDNETVNKIAEITLRSDLSNFVFYPYDCPHREKNGWTADAAISTEQVLYSLDAADSYRQWLQMIVRAQRDDGALPGIVPTAGWGFNWGNGPAWDSVLVELPYQLNRFYGDTKVVHDCADAINKYFDYITSRLNGDGLVAIGLGDWCQTYALYADRYETPLEVTDSLTMLDIANKTIAMYASAGIDAEKIKSFRANILNSFRAKYVRDGIVAAQTQTALAMCLQLGVTNEAESERAFADLLALIHKDDDHFRVGVIGYKYLFDTLVAHGEQNLCLKLIAQKSYPSYGYIIEQGATTLWESFHEFDEDENGFIARRDGSEAFPSFNHHFWGGVLAWFYKYIGFINVLSSDNVVVEPVCFEDVKHAKATYSRNGKSIATEWIRNGNDLHLTVTVNGFACVVKHGGVVIKLLDGTHELDFKLNV